MSDGVLPSFPSLRARNLRTLYGGSDDGGGIAFDRSPKGSVDERIRPLVDLINSHPDYVTLSSCSGRVALFDPGEGAAVVVVDDDDAHDDDGGGDDVDERRHGSDAGAANGGGGGGGSGKGGGGRWIFVTHDVLPDLGERVVDSLRRVGLERRSTSPPSSSSATTAERRRRGRPPRALPMITFKHEPPLLHVAASNLEAGRRLLRIFKSDCAMRESGLVVTGSRVTVEARTTSTSLCVPIMVDAVVDRRRTPPPPPPARSETSAEAGGGDEDDGGGGRKDGCAPAVALLSPGEDYLMALSDVANERMVRNGVLIDRLLRAVRGGLVFPKEGGGGGGVEEGGGGRRSAAADGLPRAPPSSSAEGGAVAVPDAAAGGEGATTDDDGGGGGGGAFEYGATPRLALPPLNLWKTAAVVVVRRGGRRRRRRCGGGGRLVVGAAATG